MKQNVLLSQISLVHNKNNQATVIEEEKKKQPRGGKNDWVARGKNGWQIQMAFITSQLEKSNNFLNCLHILSASLLKFIL